MIRIERAHICDPSLKTEREADVLIRDGIICSVEEPGSTKADPSDQVIDAEGLTLIPGLMDSHVHFRDPGYLWKEDLETGARAAAAGGFTRVVCMANTNPVVDTPKVLRGILERAEQLPVHVFQTASVTKGLKGKELNDLEELSRAGAAGFTDDGIPILSEELLTRAMQIAKKLDKPISLHEEDPFFICQPGINAGDTAAQLGLEGAYRTAEEVMTARDCMLALHTQAKVCIQHISSGRSVELIRLAKKLGADIHAEASPHHFTLTEEAVLQYGTNAKMNPPLRTAWDLEMIRGGLADGVIDLIATDHAPHAREEKNKPFSEAPSGIIGLETSFSLGLSSLVEKGYLTLMQLLEKMIVNPARLYGIKPSMIQAGEEAELVLFDPKASWTAGPFVSKSSNTPFTGWILPGKIHHVFCRGREVFRS